MGIREIIFRGKHENCSNMGLDNPIWVYGYLSAENYINSKKYECEMFVDKETVGQYTGFNDKNGVKIYEGDILLYKNYIPCHCKNSKPQDVIVYVHFYESGFETSSFRLLSGHDKGRSVKLPLYNYFDMFEVIGNIYDNKELLEKGE